MKNLTYYPLTFTGRRDNNQDACKVLNLGNSTYFLAVADGMGGVRGGQVASNHILQNAEYILSKEHLDDLEPADLKLILAKVFNTSQQALRDKVSEIPQLSGMGTTLSAVLIKEDKIVWGNIGDSRVYLLRNGELKQLTVDHTYIEDYKKTKGDDIPQSIIDQYSHYLTRAIDGGADEAELFPIEKPYETLLDGDVILICSDGLISNKAQTDTDLLKNYILGTSSLKKAAKYLVSSAFYNKSKDNITAVLAEYGELKREKKKITKYFFPPVSYFLKNLFDNKKYWLIAIVVLIALLFLFIFVF